MARRSRFAASTTFRTTASSTTIRVTTWITPADRKSTRLNSSHLVISYADFCLNKNDFLALLRYGRGARVPDIHSGGRLDALHRMYVNVNFQLHAHMIHYDHITMESRDGAYTHT